MAIPYLPNSRKMLPFYHKSIISWLNGKWIWRCQNKLKNWKNIRYSSDIYSKFCHSQPVKIKSWILMNFWAHHKSLKWIVGKVRNMKRKSKKKTVNWSGPILRKKGWIIWKINNRNAIKEESLFFLGWLTILLLTNKWSKRFFKLLLKAPNAQ